MNNNNLESKTKDLLNQCSEKIAMQYYSCEDLMKKTVEMVQNDIDNAQLKQSKKHTEKIGKYLEWVQIWLEDMKNKQKGYLLKAIAEKLRVAQYKISGMYSEDAINEQFEQFARDIENKSKEYED